MAELDPYPHWSLSDRLQMLAFAAELANLPRSLITAILEALTELNRLDSSMHRKAQVRASGLFSNLVNLAVMNGDIHIIFQGTPMCYHLGIAFSSLPQHLAHRVAG